MTIPSGLTPFSLELPYPSHLTSTAPPGVLFEKERDGVQPVAGVVAGRLDAAVCARLDVPRTSRRRRRRHRVEQRRPAVDDALRGGTSGPDASLVTARGGGGGGGEDEVGAAAAKKKNEARDAQSRYEVRFPVRIGGVPRRQPLETRNSNVSLPARVAKQADTPHLRFLCTFASRGGNRWFPTARYV